MVTIYPNKPNGKDINPNINKIIGSFANSYVYFSNLNALNNSVSFKHSPNIKYAAPHYIIIGINIITPVSHKKFIQIPPGTPLDKKQPLNGFKT